MEFIKNALHNVRHGHDRSSQSFFGGAAYCLACCVLGLVALLADGWNGPVLEGVWRLGVLLIIVDAMITIGAFALGLLARKGEQERKSMLNIHQ